MARKEINFKRLEEVFEFGSPNTTTPRYISYDGSYKNIALKSEVTALASTVSTLGGKVDDKANVNVYATAAARTADTTAASGTLGYEIAGETWAIFDEANGWSNIVFSAALAGLAKVVDITHAGLAAAKEAGSLVAGYIYRITDYPLGESDPKGEVLILATAANTLATNAWVLPTVAYADPAAEE